MTESREALIATLPEPIQEALPLGDRDIPFVMLLVLNALHARTAQLQSVRTFSQVLPPALMQAPEIAEAFVEKYGSGTPPGQAAAAARLRTARGRLGRLSVTVDHLVTDKVFWGLPLDLADAQGKRIAELKGHLIRVIPSTMLPDLGRPEGFDAIPSNIMVIEDKMRGTCALVENTTRRDGTDRKVAALDGPPGIMYPWGSEQVLELARFREKLGLYATALPASYIVPRAFQSAQS